MKKDAIIYSTLCGTTRETAERMRLASKGKADIFDIKENPSVNIDKYSRVFVGSGIYAKKFSKEIDQFITSNASKLNSKEVILFVHGLAPEAEGKKMVEEAVNNRIPSSKYKTYYLGGKLDLKHKNLFLRMFSRFIANMAKLDPKNPSNINEQRVEELIKCVSMTS
ncbi:MAG: flavodoxin domain-containing protein [Clostridia bacterium]|nr:flavodoxin domain-containing protein [Clostridia bacterium]